MSDDRWNVLNQDFRDELQRDSTTVKFTKGERIYTQGDTAPPWLLRIQEGEVELRISIDGWESVIGYKRPGDLMAWFVVFQDKPNAFGAVAATDAIAYAYPQEKIVEAFHSNAEFASEVARAMDENIFMIHRHIAAQSRVRTIDKVETFPFRKRVSEIMKSPAMQCPSDISIKAAAKYMSENQVTSLVLCDKGKIAIGIITEKDFLKSVFDDSDLINSPVSELMSSPVKGISPGSYVYQAMGLMRQKDIRHLPVMDRGQAVGMVTMRDLLTLRSNDTLTLISQIEEELDPKELAKLRQHIIPIICCMMDENVPALDIAELITHVNKEVHRRAIHLTLKEMGEPPVDFLFFVTGSHGRGENHLITDQDHGMILAPYPPERHNEIESYFVPFTEKVCDILADAGLPYCDGNVMCRNPVWRKTLPEWKSNISIWMRGTDQIRVRYLTLFADIAPIYGNDAFLTELRQDFLQRFKKSANVLRALYEEAANHTAPLGLFSRIITDKGESHHGEIDLKKSGLTFMVEAMRILAIKNGIEAPGTMERLSTLSKMGIINSEDCEFLEASYRTLFHFLLKTQLSKAAMGEDFDTFMKVYLLSERDYMLLVRAMQSVKKMQSILHAEFGNVFF